MPYTIKEIRKNVLQIEADTQYEIASMFLRPQEYYESPFENIYRNVFTLDEYMDTYAKKNGAFTYYTDWNGFNIPGNILNEFYTKFQYILNKKEIELYNLIKSLVNVDKDKYYVIGTCKSSPVAIKHEVAHAYWYLYSSYKKSMKEIIYNSDEQIISKIEDHLLNMGYKGSMIYDEIQAYLSTGFKHWLLEHIEWRKIKNVKIDNLSLFTKCFKENDAIYQFKKN
jgi:hypothetical protein